MAEDNPTKLCECGCGKPTAIAKQTITRDGCIKGQPKRFVAGHSLRVLRHRGIKHGHCRRGKRSPVHAVWSSMKARCSNPSAPAYYRYGARGIKVCDRWQSFENFLDDMGEPPPGASLDRIDNDGDYEPGNCRWATMEQQSFNKANTFYLTAFGRTQTLKQWAEERGLTYLCLLQRVRTYGWTVETALTTPPRITNRRK